MNLMRQIREYQTPKGAAALWWFGQNGYILKSAEGTLAGVDLYLTDSCAAAYPEVNLHRKIPALIEPEDLEVDIFACTHNHQDHTDPETIGRLRNKDTFRFLGPAPSCAVYRQQQVEEGRITVTYPDFQGEFADLRVIGTFALPTDDSDLNHMGFVFQFGTGPKIYVTGDTDYHELLAATRKHEPDVMITCINGGYNNLSHWEAAKLAAEIKPKVAIPCHYDLFPDNCCDPKQFRAALTVAAPSVLYQEMTYGEPLLISLA